MSDVLSPEYVPQIQAGEDYEYALIRFRHQGPRKKVEEIDVVPTDWLFLMNESLQCKFLSSKYLEIAGKVQLLHSLVEKRGPVPIDWPSFPVKAVGRAHTYEEALGKLELLSKTDNVFTDSEGGSNEAEAALIRQIKRRMLLVQQETLKGQMEMWLEDEGCSTAKKKKKLNEAVDDEMDVTLNSPEKLLSTGTSALPSESQDSGTSGTEADASHAESSVSSNGIISNSSQSVPQSSTGCFSNGSDAQNIENLPIVDISSVECKNDFETAVIYYLRSFDKRLGNLEIAVENLVKKQREITKYLDFTEFCEKYELDLPFKTSNEFTNFNATLSTPNKSLKRDLYNVFRGCLDSELSVTKTFGKILRKFICKDVLLTYTAVKAVRGKKPAPGEKEGQEKGADKLFQPLEFCKCMYAFMRTHKKVKNPQGKVTTIEDKDLRKALSEVFSNVRKWKCESQD